MKEWEEETQKQNEEKKELIFLNKALQLVQAISAEMVD